MTVPGRVDVSELAAEVGMTVQGVLALHKGVQSGEREASGLSGFTPEAAERVRKWVKEWRDRFGDRKAVEPELDDDDVTVVGKMLVAELRKGPVSMTRVREITARLSEKKVKGLRKRLGYVMWAKKGHWPPAWMCEVPRG